MRSNASDSPYEHYSRSGPQGRRSTVQSALVASVWAILVCTGFWIAVSYSLTAGPQVGPSANWPSKSLLAHEAGRPTLVIFCHPRCPCSRATIGELSRLMVQNAGTLRTVVVFVRPPETSEEWVKTGLWRSSGEIPGVQRLIDRDGSEARYFNARTSGQALLYDHGGRLAFSGGITAARGHWGDNAGSKAIQSFLESGNVSISTTPIFGCDLYSESDSPERQCEQCSQHYKTLG